MQSFFVVFLFFLREPFHSRTKVKLSPRNIPFTDQSQTNRFQRVVIPGGISEWLEILAGVHQGSILGPLLFIMFINDIVKEIHSNIRLFADDTSLYIIVDFPDSAAQILNVDLERIYKWAVQWLVRFNPNKTESFLFSRKLNIQHHPTLFLMTFPYKKLYHTNI